MSKAIWVWFFLSPSSPSAKISILVDEKNALVLENKTLREQKSSLELDAAGLTGKKLLLLQTQIEQLQEENFRYDKYWGIDPLSQGCQICFMFLAG